MIVQPTDDINSEWVAPEAEIVHGIELLVGVGPGVMVAVGTEVSVGVGLGVGVALVAAL